MLFSRDLYTADSSIPTSVAALNTDLIVVQANVTSVADASRARNPNIKVLMYTSPIDCEPNDTNGIISGVQYSVANPNESWFLHNASTGARIPHGTASYLLNLGNTGVQNAFLSHVQTLAANYKPSSGAYDGLFFDDFFANLVGYPTTTEYGAPSSTGFITSFQSAMAAFLDAVIPTLHAAGFSIILGNIPYGASYPINSGNPTQGSQIWALYLGSVDGVSAPTKERLDGGMEESWMNGGAPATTPAGEQQQASVFLNRIGEAKWAHDNNRYFIGHSYSPVVGTNANEQGHRYALGALLLVGGDTGGKLTCSIYGQWPTDLNVPWFPCYQNALALGTPSGAYVANGDGTYSRTFANGNIKVNPTGATAGGVPAFDTVFTITSAPAAPVNTAAPVITGTARFGSTVQSTTGTWTGTPAPTFAYQWNRNGVAISSANSSSYTIVAADLGQSLTCTVTATNSQGNATATSAAVVPSTTSAGPARRVLTTSTNTVHPAEFATTTLLTASNSSWPIPTAATLLEVTLVGGGGQGGGGGTNAAAAANEGGCGGGAGQTVMTIVSVGGNTTLNVTIGAGGTGAGAGGAAGGNAGTAGNNGSATTITATGISLSADGGSGGVGGNASGTTTQTGGMMGLSNSGLRTQATLGPGGGGQVGANAGGGGDGIGWGGGGGGGGGTSSSTLGGGGGAAGGAAGVSHNGGQAGGTATQAGAAGGNGASAAANSGAGGGGGGGAPSGGAGGNGGNGGSGFAVIRVIG